MGGLEVVVAAVKCLFFWTRGLCASPPHSQHPHKCYWCSRLQRTQHQDIGLSLYCVMSVFVFGQILNFDSIEPCITVWTYDMNIMLCIYHVILIYGILRMLFSATNWYNTKEYDWFHLKQQIGINIKNVKVNKSFVFLKLCPLAK